MKLTTKRNRWYFWKELFSYMIPMILIVWVVDVFRNFMICPLHPEWSAPCNVNRIIAAIYWIFLLLTIVLAIISAKMLKKIRKKIENEFIDVITNEDKKGQLKPERRSKEINKELQKEIRPKNIIAKNNKKSDKKRKISRKTK